MATGSSNTNFKIELTTATLQSIECKKKDNYNPTSFHESTLPSASGVCGAGNPCCFFSFNPSTRVLKVGLDILAWDSANLLNNKNIGLQISGNYLRAPGRTTDQIQRSKPGSSSYYLRRLGRLELSGIPQMAYEELYCSDNAAKLVPGIFKPSVKYNSDFSSSSFSWTQTYTSNTSSSTNILTTKRFTNHLGLQHEPIFSQNDFKCCAPLGTTVTDQTRCCSGFGLPVGTSNNRTCALPNGTNLMVYFNRFVSNEGVGTDKPGGGLTEADFETLTGEPKLVSTVTNKIRAMGEAYCISGKVRQGGAFGAFTIQPQGSQTNLTQTNYGIIDSTLDIGQNSNAGATLQTGYPAFSDGYRWNHHLYCDDD